jgi:hypothetical protein
MKEREECTIMRFMISALYQILFGDHIKEDKMGTFMRCEKHTQTVIRKI